MSSEDKRMAFEEVMKRKLPHYNLRHQFREWLFEFYCEGCATQQAPEGEPDAIQKFIDAQQPLDPECARVLHENFWDLIDNGPQTTPHTVAGSAGQAPNLLSALAKDGNWRDIDQLIGSILRGPDIVPRQRAAQLLTKIRDTLTAPSLTTDAGAVPTDEQIKTLANQHTTMRGIDTVAFARALLAAHTT